MSPPSGQKQNVGTLKRVWTTKYLVYAPKPGPFLVSQRLGRGKRTGLAKEKPPGLLWKVLYDGPI